MAESAQSYNKAVKTALQAGGLRVKKLPRATTGPASRRYKVKAPDGTKFKVTVKTCE